MDITIATCTKGRNDLLRATLESIAASDAVNAQWHVVLVDNNPDGSAAAVAAAFEQRFAIDYVRESTPGASPARNRAIARAKGRWIIWIDDDVRVDPGLLAAYATAFQRWPAADFFGGAVRAVFEQPSPPWLEATQDLLLPLYGQVSPGPEGTKILDPFGPLPITANCAVAAEVQRRFLFDTNRGPRPGRLAMRGEDNDVTRRMIRAGMTGLWLPSAKADHWIPRTRQTARELRRVLSGQGFAYGQQWGGLFEKTLACNGDAHPPLQKLIRQSLHREVQYVLARLQGDERRWVPALIGAAFASGMLHGRLARKPHLMNSPAT
jgi:GT2 family glycosyltransferase